MTFFPHGTCLMTENYNQWQNLPLNASFHFLPQGGQNAWEGSPSAPSEVPSFSSLVASPTHSPASADTGTDADHFHFCWGNYNTLF